MRPYKPVPIDTRTDEEKVESLLYWQAQGPAAAFAEGIRLSKQHYGTPVGDLRDGPLIKYRRMPDGSLHILSETSGPNPLRHVEDESINAL